MSSDNTSSQNNPAVSNESTDGTSRSVSVSPIPPAAVNTYRQATGLHRNLPAPLNVDSVPSRFLCSITKEPPARACYLNYVSEEGGGNTTRHHLFDYSSLFRSVATPGTHEAAVHFVHPILGHGCKIRRDRVMNYVIDALEYSDDVARYK